jgi:hypothetical protein
MQTVMLFEVIIHSKYIEASSSGYDIAIYKVDDSPLQGKMERQILWPACLPQVTLMQARKLFANTQRWARQQI